MPAGRTIYGVCYYSVKKNSASFCVQCGKKIPILSQAYARGAKNSSDLLCRACMITLSDRYQQEKYGRIPFPENAILHVGLLGHTCLLLDETNFSTKTAIFRKERKSAYLPVSYCQKCNRFFIEKAEYQKNTAILSKYRLLDTITGKPIPGSKDWSMEYIPSKEEQEYPASVVWAYQHPFQGGGCSGK